MARCCSWYSTPVVAKIRRRADNHGVKPGLIPGVVLLLAVAALTAAHAFGVIPIPWAVSGAGAVVSLLAFLIEPLVVRAIRAGKAPVLDASLVTAVPEWRAGRRSALEGMVAEFAGPRATAHALRCAALADMLAEQLALLPAETADVSLAALVHVLPAAFPEVEDATFVNCEFSLSSLSSAIAVLERSAPAGVARLAAEVCERWDGTGRPNRLAGEGISMGGRVLAAACLFDHASTTNLEAGIELVRSQSGKSFDPVVASELIHLFREPWQRQVAAA